LVHDHPGLASHEQGQVRNRQLTISKMVVESMKEHGHGMPDFCIFYTFWIQLFVIGTGSMEPKKDRPCRRVEVVDEIKAVAKRRLQVFDQE
jgi:hypothetical protein